VRRHTPLLELFISELYLAAQQGTGEHAGRSVERERLRCVLVLACVWSARRHWLLSASCSSHLPLLMPLIKHSADMAFLQFSKAFRPDDVTILYLSYCMFIKLCDFCLHFTANELENSEFFSTRLAIHRKSETIKPEVVYRCLDENFKNLNCKPSGRNDTQNISFLYHSFFSSVGLVPQKNTFRDHN